MWKVDPVLNEDAPRFTILSGWEFEIGYQSQIIAYISNGITDKIISAGFSRKK